MKLESRQELEDLRDIARRNVKELGNAINQYTSAVNVLEKKDKGYDKKRSDYMHRIHQTKHLQAIEEEWLAIYEGFLAKMNQTKQTYGTFQIKRTGRLVIPEATSTS